MASRWFRKTGDQEVGPVTFQDLAEMIRAGTLTEDDRVRREFSEDWVAARDVIGLFRAVRITPATTPPLQPEAEPSLPESSVLPPAAKARQWPRLRLNAWTWTWVVGGIGLLLAGMVGYELWFHRSSRRFPESALKRPRHADKMLMESLRASRSKVPSMPDLPERSARPIPGLEKIEPGFSPCLTPDLKIIIFAGTGNPGTAYDLYLATRSDISLPFGAPHLIRSTASPETEAYPSVSSDGLELVFLRGERPRQMFRCTREMTSSEFGTPVLIPTPEWRTAKRQPERTQFIDPQHLVFCAVDYAGNARSFFTLVRTDPKASFASPKQMPLPVSLPPYYFFSANGLRAYYAMPDGLFVSSRTGQDEMFGEGTLLVSAAKSGPIAGPIWVTPQEDVLVYCSAGPGKEVNSARKLWMFRF